MNRRVSIRWLDSTERAVAGRIWEELENRLTNTAFASSWDWTGAWLEQYGDIVPHRFALAEVEDAARGIVLVTEGSHRRSPFNVRTVHLGTAGEPQDEGVFVVSNRVLVEPEHRAGFASALMTEIRGARGWHELKLDRFAPEEAAPFLAAEPTLEAKQLVCRVMDLRDAEAAEGGVLGALRSRTRNKVRRSLKGLGEVKTELAKTPGQALDVLDELIDLHQRRWNNVGEPGAFASPRVVAFHRELVPRLMSKEAAILVRVRAEGGTVGCRYGFVEDGRMLGYQTGLATYDDNRISPGFVTHVCCMQACLERGLMEYDFSVGDSSYKRELSTTTRELVTATARRPALRWKLMDQAAAARRGLRSDPDSG
jgi:hypothetical protein